MSFSPKNYVTYWKQFSKHIRFERAGNKCERCGAVNGEIVERGTLQYRGGESMAVWRDFQDGRTYDARTGKYLGQFRADEIKVFRFSKIVLTVAHLDGENGVCRCKQIYGFKCAKPNHVLALCQSCHLSYDRKHHLAVQAENRAIKKDSARGLFAAI